MEDTTSMTLGKRILYHRKRLGMTQDQLAVQMGVTAQAVSKWEHDLSCPDVTTLPRLAELFGITTDELLGTRPQDPATVHIGEVEDPPRNWSWNFQWDKGGVLFALFLVALGAAYITVTLLKLQVGFWSLLWPLALVYVGLSSCLNRFSAFGGGAMAAGVYFLLVNLGVIPSLITWPIILGALLVLWGVSMILDQTRKRQQKRKVILRSGHSENQPRRSYDLREGYADVDIVFCSDNIHVQTPELQGGNVDLAFGSLILNFADCGALAPNCCLELDCAFSSLVLQVPGRYRVDLNLERTGASLDISGAPSPTPEAALRLTGDCSFGSMKIQYI